MLKRFDNTMLMKEVRGSSKKYFIMLDGSVYEKNAGKCQIKCENAVDLVYCEFLGKLGWHPIYDLIAVHFKFMERLSDDEVAKVRGFYAPSKRGYDKGHGKHHPYHCGYRFEGGKLEVKGHQGFYYVPGHLSRAIDSSGNLYSISRNTPLTWYSTKPGIRNSIGGYLFNRIDDGASVQSLNRHRAMMMVFSDYPDNCDLLIVNHINGIPGDDRLDNLEWISRKGNINHAYESGLRSQNKPVLARNIFTGEVTEYYSVAECGRQLNILDKTLNYRLEKLSFSTVGRQGYQFKYKDDERDWIIPDDPHAALAKAIQARKVSVTEVEDGKETIYGSVGLAAKATGVNQSTVAWRVQNNVTSAKNGFIFKYA